LLNEQVNKGKITEDERNKILESMTQEVSDLVLQDNFNQALVMSIATFFSPQFITLHQNYIKDMEAASIINRNVEYLPEEKRLLERKASGLGLTRPELAVLLAYTKIHLKNEILNSDIPENAYFSQILDTAFPASLKKHYAKEMANHSLHREIVATQLSNFIVNEHGITFVHNLYLEMGSSVPEIIRAAIAAIRIYGTSELQEIIQALDFKIPIATQYELLGHIRRLIYLSTRWFLRRKRLTNENMEEIINHFSKNVKELQDLIPSLMGGFTKNYLETLSEQFKQANISQDDARRIAGARAMYTSLNIIDIATQNKFDLKKTARIYFAVGEYFNLLWFRDRLASDNREGYWEALSRLTLRDQLDTLQKQITIVVMNNSKNENDTKKSIETWIEENHRSMERWEKIMEMLHSSTSLDYAMYFIALRELSDLINTGVEV
jgi:glutamate dehydrogenase